MGTQDIEIVIGEDFSFSLTITVDSAPLPLVGATVHSQIRAYASRTAELITEFDVAIEGDVITLSLTDQVTSQIPYSSGYYDVLVVQNGVDKYYLKGAVSFVNTATVK